MNDDQLLRYSRQIMLPDFGIEAQQRLNAAHVLIIGAGGLGSPAALYLAAAGVGRLSIADPDRVEVSNLQRQILHGQPDLDRPKVDSARERLADINPDTRVIPIAEHLEAAALQAAVAAADLVVDASDNFVTRFAVNTACWRAGRPLVSGAAIRYEGQLSVFRGDLAAGPCYQCLYRDGAETEQTCAENGILAPIVGIIGSLQALEAIKVLTGVGEPLGGRLLILDGRSLELRTLNLRPDPHCPVCSGTREQTPAHPAGTG
ncbi:MAG TPA: molybdopterin-synthase adenylyltransferase MoeB [Thiohalobacter sp.]|nr:molybdopterin-synthase adenylyltransferase MoeB [Thiohalobacter sp.]